MFVTATVNTPDPEAMGLLMVVLFKEPVAGTVQVYTVFGSELLVANNVAVGDAQVVVNELGVNVVVGTIVFWVIVVLAVAVQPFAAVTVNTYVPP